MMDGERPQQFGMGKIDWLGVLRRDSTLQELLTERDVARIIGLSVASIRRFRLLRTGPRFIKVSGSAVRYRPEDLKAYLDGRPSGGGLQWEAR